MEKFIACKNNDSENMASQIKYLIEKPHFASEISMRAFEDSKNFSTDLVIPNGLKLSTNTLNNWWNGK